MYSDGSSGAPVSCCWGWGLLGGPCKLCSETFLEVVFKVAFVTLSLRITRQPCVISVAQNECVTSGCNKVLSRSHEIFPFVGLQYDLWVQFAPVGYCADPWSVTRTVMLANWELEGICKFWMWDTNKWPSNTPCIGFATILIKRHKYPWSKKVNNQYFKSLGYCVTSKMMTTMKVITKHFF